MSFTQWLKYKQASDNERETENDSSNETEENEDD
jgi:hypothetical protein